MQKPIYIIISIIIIGSIVAGITVFYMQHKKAKDIEYTLEKIETAVAKYEYEEALQFLKNNDISEMQAYYDQNLTQLERSLPVAIELDKVYHQKESRFIELFIENVETLSEQLKQQAINRYANILDILINQERYDEIYDYNQRGLIKEEYLPKETKMQYKDLFFMKELVDLAYSNNWEEILIKAYQYNDRYYGGKDDTLYDYINLLSSALDKESLGYEDRIAFYLVRLPENYNNFPEPFQENYNRLMNQYKNTESYKSELAQLNGEYEDPFKPFTEKVQIGMTPEQVRVAVGIPDDINRRKSIYGESEQWVYSGYKYVYFENGRVTSVSD